MTGSHSSQMSRMVAPYWSDIDTRCGGDIWYRQVQLQVGDNLYSRIYDEVANAGVAHVFRPTSAVIVTWEEVTCQNGISCLDTRVSMPLSSTL